MVEPGARDLHFHLPPEASGETDARGRGRDAAGVRARLRRAVAAAEGGARNEKTGRRKALYRVDLDGDGVADHLVKVTRYRGWDAWRRRLGGSKARLELARAGGVAARGVATPQPLGAVEWIERGALRACYLAVPILPGARDLRHVVEAEAPTGADRRALAAAFGAFARRVHDAGVDQDDFAPNNFLLGPGGPADLSMIDFERARLEAHTSQAARRAMLAKLARELPGLSLGDRGRFLRGYDAAGWRALWRSVEVESLAMAGRDAARLARVVARPGRRFGPLRAAGFEGHVLRSADGPALADALARAAAAAPPHPGFPLQALGAHYALRLPTGRPDDARRAFAVAHLLARRGGLAPAPAAVVWRPGEALLLVADEVPATLGELPAAERAQALPRLVVFLDRLLALGALDPGLDPGAIALGPASGPQLLRVWGFDPGRSGGAPRHARARELAARLLAAGP